MTMLQKRFSTMRRAALAAALVGGLAVTLLPGAASAQAWPAKPIRLLIPFTAGGAQDVIGRLFAKQVGESLGQQMVVENKAGAGGLIATQEGARAAPDGYTLLLSTGAQMAIEPALNAKAGYDPVKDFAPLAICARLMSVLVVNPDSGITSVRQLLDKARAAPGTVTYGSAGSGSSNHLASELLSVRAGVQLVHVPYRGGVQHAMDLMAGRIDMLIDNLPNVLANVQAGKMRALAVTGSERDPALPDVPTMMEAGVPDYVLYVWFGFAAPAATPAPILQRLSAEIIRIVSEPTTAAQLEARGGRVWVRDPAQFAALLRQELETWGSVIRAAGIRAE